MFFEQNRIEPELGVARFLWLSGRHAQAPEVFQNRLDRGLDALVALERGLATSGSPFVAGGDYTVADIALYAYVHCGAESGADPREHADVAAWLDRVEATPGFENDLAPFPEHAVGAAHLSAVWWRGGAAETGQPIWTPHASGPASPTTRPPALRPSSSSSPN